MHACNTVVNNMDQMRAQEQHVPASQTHHKEEAKASVKTDTKDRKALRDKLEVCIDPLHPEDNQQGLVNIVTGQVLTHPSLNVDHATELGTKHMEEFERTWPATFHETLHKCVTTMAAIAQRQGKVNNMKILGTGVIYARAMALQCSQRYYDNRNLMVHELASRPASMFDDSGAMKVAKTKAVLKNTVKVQMERRHAFILRWICSTVGRAMVYRWNCAILLQQRPSTHPKSYGFK